MNNETIEKRIAELEQALTQTLANYNALLGRKEEAKYFLEHNKQELDPENKE